MRLFAHPARDRFAKLPPGYTPFVVNRDFDVLNRPVPRLPSSYDRNRLYSPADEKVAELVAEVHKNGFGDDLTVWGMH